jgi:hypothetical protein
MISQIMLPHILMLLIMHFSIKNTASNNIDDSSSPNEISGIVGIVYPVFTGTIIANNESFRTKKFRDTI